MRPWELTDLRSRKASSTQNRVGVNRMRDCLRVAALSTICERGIGGRKRGRAIFWCEEMGERDERFFGCGCGHPVSHLRAAGAEGAAKPFIVRWADEEDLCGERERAKERW